MIEKTSFVYTLDNYDNISVASVGNQNELPFVVVGYPESNITVIYTKEKKELFPCWFFTENEIGFGKECVVSKKENGNMIIAVIAQNELDSSSTYFYEVECKDGIYQFENMKKSRKPILNKNQTITNSISMCSDNSNKVLILVAGYTLLTDKGGVILHYKSQDQENWDFVDMTNLCGNDMNVGKASSLLYINQTYYLLIGGKDDVNVFTSTDIKNWTLLQNFKVENFVNFSSQTDAGNNVLLSIISKNKHVVYKLNTVTNNTEILFECDNTQNTIKSQIIFDDNDIKVYIHTADNKINVIDLVKNENVNLISENYNFLMNVFVDFEGNTNIVSFKTTLRSDYLLIKDLKINNYQESNLHDTDTEELKNSITASYCGNNESTRNNTKERANMLKYLFDEYFDTLDSNTFSSYRCFFMKLMLNKKNSLFNETGKLSKLYTIENNTKTENKCLNYYTDINRKGGSKLYINCILGYVSADSYNDIPKPFDLVNTENKYICFMQDGENYFPNGKLEKIDEKEMEMLDLILESKVVIITSLNYSTLKNLSIGSLVKVHFFTHRLDEEDESKFLKWKTLDGKVLEFPLFGMKDLFYNGLEQNIKVKLQVTSILEDFFFTIDSKCLNGDLAGKNINELILYQIKTDDYVNILENGITELSNYCVPSGCCSNL